MDAIRLEHGFLYYYENRAGYLKNELCYVDPIFFTRELRLLLKEHYGYAAKEEAGLYPRLLSCRTYGDDGKAHLVLCRIWQWREEVPAEKKYLSYETYRKEYQNLSLDDYRIVYDGYMETKVLEEIFQKFHTNLPEGFPGHAISMSDIIELYDENSGSSFFYVDEYSFVEIEVKQDGEKKLHCNLGRTGCGKKSHSSETGVALSDAEHEDSAVIL